MYLCYVSLLWYFSNTVVLYDKGLLFLWCLLALLGTSLSMVRVIWLVEYGSSMVCFRDENIQYIVKIANIS